MDGELITAIEDLYRVFKRYTFAGFSGFSYAENPKDYEHLSRIPLRELRASDLEKYTWSATLTVGDASDFRHFLPRIFEMLALHGDRGLADAEVFVGLLSSRGRLESWPAEEQQSVRTFLLAWWRDVLMNEQSAFEARTVLCALGRAEVDLIVYLNAWDQLLETPGPALHSLARFVIRDVHLNKANVKLANAFWSHRSPQEGQVLRWLRRPELRAALERGFFAAKGEEAEALSMAAQSLEGLAARE